MSVFEPTNSVDPLLHVYLNAGEEIFAESNAMVSMDASMSLKGKARGGVLASLSRKLFTGESFFQQCVKAERGPGDVYLAPILPGGMAILNVGEHEFMIADGAYLASDCTVDISTKMQNLLQAGFAGTGGFLVMHAGGRGNLAVSGFGSLRVIEVTEDKPVIINNGHVVAWDAALAYSVEFGAGGGMLGSLVHGELSGSEFVLRFKGTGKVIISSRNRNNFTGWIAEAILPKNT